MWTKQSPTRKRGRRRSTKTIPKVRTDASNVLGERTLSCKKIPRSPSCTTSPTISPPPLKLSPSHSVSTSFWTSPRLQNSPRRPEVNHVDGDNAPSNKSPLKARRVVSVKKLLAQDQPNNQQEQGSEPGQKATLGNEKRNEQRNEPSSIHLLQAGADGAHKEGNSHVHVLKEKLMHKMATLAMDDDEAVHTANVELSMLDVHDLISTLAEFESMLSMGNVHVDDFDDVSTKEIIGEYSPSTKSNKTFAMRKWGKALKSISNKIHPDKRKDHVQFFKSLKVLKVPASTIKTALGLLQDFGKWHLDILELGEICGKETFAFLAHLVCQSLPLDLDSINVDPEVLHNYMEAIARHYREDNPYHNALHGADVGHAVFHFLTVEHWDEFMKPLEVFSCVMAGFLHDCGHPGVNNAYLVNTSHMLALRYHDRSPLENMHAAIAMETLKEDGCNFMATMTRGSRKTFRSILIETILGTDNALHFDHIMRLQDNLMKGHQKDNPFTVGDEGSRMFILQLLLHLCDLSNPAKPLSTYLQWCDLVMAEFHMLGDKEKEAGLPVGHIFKRETPLHDVQIGFVKYLVNPFYLEMNKIGGVDLKTQLSCIDINLKYFQDIKKLKEEEEKKENDAKKE